MVIAYHSIFSAYGFWLPNDPRGSWSEFVASWELFLAGGKATKANGTHSVAGRQHDVRKRMETKRALRFPPVCFTGEQARAVGRGFAETVAASGYEIYACAILPEHVHVVTARCGRPTEKVIGHLKTAATMRLFAEGLHPFVDARRPNGRPPSPWAEKAWHVFLDAPADVMRAIRYVRNNPLKEGKREQRWAFVKEYQMGG